MQRRKLLKSISTVSASSALGVNALFGSVSAAEVNSTELKRLEQEPEVQKILRELGEDDLQNVNNIDKRLVGDDNSLSLFKLYLDYGTILLAERDNQLGASFTFDKENLSKAPHKYQRLPQTAASLSVTDGKVVFRRVATEKEKELVMSAIDLDSEVINASVYTGSDITGFRADLRISSNKSDDIQSKNYHVNGKFLDDFDPRRTIVSDKTSSNISSSLSVKQIETGSNDIQTQGVASSTLKRIIIDWIEGQLAIKLSERLGPCGPSCTGCADWIVSLVLDCKTCKPICSIGATPKTAIICVLCVYAFCNNTLNMFDCSRCAACLIEGEEQPDPRDGIWERLPSPPSLP